MKKYSHLLSFFLITLGIAGALYGCFFFYKKIYLSLDNHEQAVLEKQIQQEQLQNIPELAKSYDNIIQNENSFSFVYPEDAVVEIIKDIERLAREESVTLTITQKDTVKKSPVKADETLPAEGAAASAPVEEKPKELLDSLPFEKYIALELQAEGQYLAIRNFLHKLETAPYALDILSVNASLMPLDELGTTTAPVQESVDDSPFLLQGEVLTEEAPVVEAIKIQNVTAIFEMALYTK